MTVLDQCLDFYNNTFVVEEKYRKAKEEVKRLRDIELVAQWAVATYHARMEEGMYEVYQERMAQLEEAIGFEGMRELITWP